MTSTDSPRGPSHRPSSDAPVIPTPKTEKTDEYRYKKVEAKKKVFKNSPDYYRIIAPNGNHAGVCMSEERAQWLTDRFNGRKPKGTRGTT